jgi:hypothetical protein
VTSRWLLAGLMTAAASGLEVASVLTGGPTIPPGMLILLAGGIAVLLTPLRVGGAVGLAAAGLVFFVLLGQPAITEQLRGDEGGVVVAARMLQLLGLIAALALSAYWLAPFRTSGSATAGTARPLRTRDRGRIGRVVGLLLLSAVAAELLAAYGDSTGDPGGVLFALVFFSALYGAPALLAREVVRRRGGGWPSLLLLFAALGVAEACLIDQSLFSADYQGYEGFEESQQATRIPGLGISAYNLWNFVLGHVIYSFGAPVALAEAWRPSEAHRPWFGSRGLTLIALAYAGAASLIASDPESGSANPEQLLGSGVVVAALLVGAVLVGHRRTPAGPRPAPRVWRVLAWVFPVALLGSVFPDNWLGVVAGVLSSAAIGVGVLLASRRYEWEPRHCAAVAVAYLSVRGLLAFTYFPLIGDVAAGPKYAHNVAMLSAVVYAGWFALRPRSAHGGTKSIPADQSNHT